MQLVSRSVLPPTLESLVDLFPPPPFGLADTDTSPSTNDVKIYLGGGLWADFTAAEGLEVVGRQVAGERAPVALPLPPHPRLP